MANNGLTGKWDQALARLQKLNGTCTGNASLVTIKTAVHLRDAMKRHIRDGDPDWPENAPLTVQIKGSSKPLIRHGDFMNSIKEHLFGPYNAFIGVSRQEQAEGKQMINIARTLVYGAIIRPKKSEFLVVPATRKAERLLRKYGGWKNIPKLFRPGDKHVLAIPAGKGKFEIVALLLKKVTIRPRDPIFSTYNVMLPTIKQRYRLAVVEAVKGRRINARQLAS